jgi:predicted transcriptional regulator
MSRSPRSRRGRGGQGGHEPRTRIRTRELRAIELAVRGWSQHQIADDLGISRAAVSKLLKRVETRLLRELADTIERQKVRHSLRLEHLFAESMRAWIESKHDATRRRQRKSQGGTGGDALVAEVTTENQSGDPRYLAEARKAMADLRKVWGLDAPQKMDLRAVRNPYHDLSEAEVLEKLAEQARLLGSSPSAEPQSIDASAADSLTSATIPDPQEPSHGTD